MDLQGLDKALHSVKSRSPFSKGKAHSNADLVDIFDEDLSDESANITVTRTDSYRFSVRANVVTQLEVPRFTFNPLVTAWELIKFSFVIDWFFSVGNAIKALSVIVMSKHYTASYGYEVRCSRETKMTVSSVTSGYTVHASRDATGESVLSARIPTSVSVIPRLQLNLNVSKIVDLLALLAQALIRR